MLMTAKGVGCHLLRFMAGCMDWMIHFRSGRHTMRGNLSANKLTGMCARDKFMSTFGCRLRRFVARLLLRCSTIPGT